MTNLEITSTHHCSFGLSGHAHATINEDNSRTKRNTFLAFPEVLEEHLDQGHRCSVIVGRVYPPISQKDVQAD